MSRFDALGGDREPEDWTKIAFKKTTEHGLQFQVIGGLVLAGVAAAALNPIAGFVVACWIVVNSAEKIKRTGRNQIAIRDYNCVAHVLEDEDFKAYARQVRSQQGDEVLLSELEFAIENGFDLSDAAYEFLESSAPQMLQPISSQKAASFLPQTQVTTQSSVHVLDHTIDIVKELTTPVQNCIIFGIGGSGKGMLVANALRRIKAENPNRKIFYIDPKNEPGEYGYTEGVVDVVERKSCKNKPPLEICDWFNKVLDDYIEWAAEQEEPLLVIDEGSIAGDAAKKCKDNRIGSLILHISSLGGAAKEKVWLLAQSPFVGPLGIDLSTTSQIVAVTLISAANTNVLKQWKRSPILEMIDLDRLNELIKASPVGRAVFFGGNSRWGAMPKLTNYSEIDRDNNKPTGDALTTEQRQSLRSASGERSRTVTATQLKPIEQTLVDNLERTKHSTLEDFIIKEMGEGDRLPQLLTAIAQTIKKANHKGLIYKFKLD
ncbi:MAG: hypothetical protein KME52_18405 [Desmonostoc geniculatum HA4340-LM1]|jgi:hypothetical protein|nr:hypothetical protein [Desmonostoc geniculatum HA4340-LM1]